MLFRFFSLLFFSLILLLGLSQQLAAQQVPTDTVGLNEDENPKALIKADEFVQINLDTTALPDPRKAAFLSAILPGMGQVYNGSLWKVPLVYAGGAAFVYAVNFYNMRYSESLRSFRTIRYNPDVQKINNRDEAFYGRQVDFYRRQRDYMIILSAAFYGLQIVEAYIDAHLQTFDLDDDLAMRIRPTLIPDPTGPMVAGIKITYTFP